MPTKPLKAYTAEFRVSSVKLAVEPGRPVSQIAKELGVNANTLHTWIGKYSKPGKQSMRTTDNHFEKNKRLKKELAHVTQEHDLLKKAAAYFAKESRWRYGKERFHFGTREAQMQAMRFLVSRCG